MKSYYPILLVFFLSALNGATDFLPRSTAEDQGIPSAAILDLVEAAEADPNHAAHSLIIVRNGHVVAEGYWAPYSKDQPHELFSLSKSFTSTAVGFAVKEGLLEIDDQVVDFFPEYTPKNAPWYTKNIRVRQLLTMSTGHMEEPELFRSEKPLPLVQQFLETEPELEPGKYFLYNTPATYMQSAIVQKLTGKRVRDYLMPRLFEPLGIETPKWDQSRDGIDYGGFGLYLKTRDIAKFGQLLLQQGNWKEEQIVPAKWIAQATSKQVSNGASPESDWNAGYGFQFWMNSTQGFRGDGAFGQLCVVLPDANMVIAMTAATRDMQQEMRWIWNLLLSRLSDHPLPADSKAQARLQAKLDSLVLAVPEGEAKPDKTALPFGETFQLEENTLGYESLRIVRQDDRLILQLETVTGSYEIPVTAGSWVPALLTRNSMFNNQEESNAFVSAAWETPTMLNLNIVFEGRCQLLRLAVSFEEPVSINPSVNVSFGPANLSEIKAVFAGDDAI